MSTKTVTLRFLRNAVAYGDVCMVLGDGVSFGIYGEDKRTMVHFFVSAKHNGDYTDIRVQYFRYSDSTDVSESFAVSGSGWTEKEFKL